MSFVVGDFTQASINIALTALSWAKTEEQHELILEQIEISEGYLDVYKEDWNHYLDQYVQREKELLAEVAAIPAATIRHDRAMKATTDITNTVISPLPKIKTRRIRNYGMRDFDKTSGNRIANHSWAQLLTDLCNNRERYEEHRRHIDDNRRWQRWFDVYQIGLKKGVAADAAIHLNMATMDAVTSAMGDTLGDIANAYAETAGYFTGRQVIRKRLSTDGPAQKGQPAGEPVPTRDADLTRRTMTHEQGQIAAGFLEDQGRPRGSDF